MMRAAVVFGVAGAVLRGTKDNVLRETAKTGVADLYPFYHTSDAIHSEAQRLAGSCPGFSLETISGSAHDSDVDIDIATYKKPNANPSNKLYFLFGEHARELISPESGLHLLKTLCGETASSSALEGVSDDTEFRVVLNGNPHSRRKVEDGDFCLRINENGVDLNRNWDEKWEPNPEFSPADTNPGPSPFSEPETIIFRDDVSSHAPTAFITIHSGTEGMYMPWAYDMEHLAERNNADMMAMLKELDDEYCQCPFGAAGKEVGYSCPGTCLDWVYEKLNTSYAFAFEIYAGEEYSSDLRQRWQELSNSPEALAAVAAAHATSDSTPTQTPLEQQVALESSEVRTDTVPDLSHDDYSSLFNEHPSDFVQLDRRAIQRATRMERDCFEQFNPKDEADFESTLDKWTKLYGDLARKINLSEKRHGR